MERPFGATRWRGSVRARDALATVIDAYMRMRRPLPRPSAIADDAADLSALESVKVDLYNAMQDARVTKSELGRRLKWHLPQVDRVLDLSHSSRIDQLEAAARAVGAKFTISLAPTVAARTAQTVRQRAVKHEGRWYKKAGGRSRPEVVVAAAASGSGRKPGPKKR